MGASGGGSARWTFIGEVETARRTSILAVLLVVLALVAITAWQQMGPNAPADERTGSTATPPPASSPPPGGTTGPPLAARLAALRAVAPASLPLRLDCAGEPVAVDSAAYGAFWSGRASVAVAAHCDAGAGSPPSSLTVLVDAASSGPARPRVAQVLVAETDDLLLQRVSATATSVTATGFGYSRSDIPRCCPDTDVARTWHWDGRQLAAAR